MPSSDVAFSDAVKAIQQARGSRGAYAKVEARGGFRTGVTDELRAFLAAIDTAFLATASAGGQPYVQHRGGPKGFIRAIDDNTLAFVDLAGNRQYVTTGNLSENPRVCLFLVDYARRRRVKVWGTAHVLPVTPALLAPFGDLDGKPEQIVAIRVEAWDVNCPQHIPQKIDASDVAAVLAKLEARIADLEAENALLRTRQFGGPGGGPEVG